MFSLRSAINAFPERLEPLFVAPDSCSAEDVLGIVTFEAGFEADPAKFRVAQYFKSCIQELGEDGECVPSGLDLERWLATPKMTGYGALGNSRPSDISFVRSLQSIHMNTISA